MGRTQIPKAAIADGDEAPTPLGPPGEGNIFLKAEKPTGNVVITTQTPWWKRIWFALTNPLLYVLVGRMRW